MTDIIKALEHHSVKVPMFHIHYELILVEDFQEGVEFTETLFPGLGLINKLEITTIAYTAQVNNPDHNAIFIILDLSKEKDSNYPELTETIVHEAVHLSWFILDLVGVKISVENHEVQAYLMESLVKDINAKIKNFKYSADTLGNL